MTLTEKQTDGQWNQKEDPDIQRPDFLTKKPKLYNRKKKASSTNGAGIIGCWAVENANRYFSIALYKKQVQADKRPQNKSSYIESDRRESGKQH